MADIVLGNQPAELLVVLVVSAAWTASGSLDGGTWQTGDQLEIKFDTGDVWNATITSGGSDITWFQTASAVQTLIAKNPRSAGLWYIAPDGTPMLWAEGPVVVRT